MANKPLLLAILLSLCAAAAFGQTFVMTGAPIMSCSGTFFDGGGSMGNYPDNQNIHTTICPDGTGGTHILLSFDSAVLVPGDILCFLDGSTVFAPALACANDFPAGQPFQVQASANNPGGCLTLTFLSDAAGNAAGWSAGISCAAPCVLPAPTNVQVVRMNGGEMTWTWNGVPGSGGYEVSVNGGPWQPANGTTAHTVSGLSPGSLVVIEIRGISANPGCTVQSITANRIYVECTLTATIASLSPALCPGTATGSAVIGASGANGAVQFFLVGNPAPFPTGNFNNVFAAGAHQVAVHDAAGCRDTATFDIGEPPAIAIQINVTDAECFADNSGAVQAAATGGSGTLTYTWRRCQGGMVMPGPVAIDLFAGCYAVTVTDANGCTAVAQDTVGEPPKFDFTSVQDSVRCFGGMDGRATVFAAGAIPPYTYLWSNGDATPTADSLPAGFHVVTVTDMIGCQAVTLVQVLQPTLLRLDSIQTTVVSCFGGNNGTATAFAQGGTPPFAFAWSSGPMSQTATGLTAGPHTVTVTDQRGCTATSSRVVTAPPDLNIQVSNTQNETCAGACDGSMTVSVSGGAPPYSIAWSDPTIPAGETAPQNRCPGTYQITATDANGCTKTATATIAAAPPVSVQFVAVAPTCTNTPNGSLTATATGGTAPYLYQWSTGATGSTIVNLDCGTYTVTVSDTNGCTQTRTDSLPCPPPLQLDSIVVQPVRCFGEANGLATVFAHGGTGTLTFLWNDPNQQFNDTATNLPPGIYTVVVSDANGCSTTASATVTEPPALGGMLAPTPVACFGGNDGSVAATISGGTPPYTYNWSTPQNTPTIVGLTPGNYTLTATDAVGCTFSPPAAVVGQPSGPIQVTAVQSRRACFGANDGEATATASGGNGAPFTYSWSSGATGPAPANFAAGTYTVTAADAKGCTAVQTVTITQWDSIRINLITILPSCPGASDGQASVNQISGGAGNSVFANYSFQWSLPGFGDTIYVNGLSANQPFSLTVTDNTGCSAVFTEKMDSLPQIVPMLQTDSITCFGLTDGTVRVVSVQSARPIALYSWSTGTAGQTISNLPAGTYTVTATDTNGCTGAATAVVHEPLPLQVALLVQALICNNDSNGSVQANPQGGVPGFSYAWNTGATAAKIENLGPGEYVVTVTDKNGCTTTSSTVLSQPNPPSVSVQTTDPTCFGYRDGLARLLVSDGALPYRFSLDGQNFVGPNTFFGLGVGNYTGYVLDGLGCITTVNFALDQPPPIEVLTDPDMTITLGDSVLLSADAFSTAGAATYTWQGVLAGDFVCADPPECSAIWAYPTYSNTYTVVVTDTNRCQGSTSVRVVVEKLRGVYVPTAFSPNSDGNNDLLVVHGKGSQIRRIKIFRVFDRWGELVYEDADFLANDAQRGWNGQFRGQDCQTGIYVWYAEVEYLDGFEQVVQGNTALIR